MRKAGGGGFERGRSNGFAVKFAKHSSSALSLVWYCLKEKSVGKTRALLTAYGFTQLIGIVIVAEPALPAGNRFCRAMRKAVASPPEAWVTRPFSS